HLRGARAALRSREAGRGRRSDADRDQRAPLARNRRRLPAQRVRDVRAQARGPLARRRRDDRAPAPGLDGRAPPVAGPALPPAPPAPPPPPHPPPPPPPP